MTATDAWRKELRRLFIERNSGFGAALDGKMGDAALHTAQEAFRHFLQGWSAASEYSRKISNL